MFIITQNDKSAISDEIIKMLNINYCPIAEGNDYVYLLEAQFNTGETEYAVLGEYFTEGEAKAELARVVDALNHKEVHKYFNFQISPNEEQILENE